MKKSLGLIALTFIIASSFAASWSGVLDNNTKLFTTDFDKMAITQSNGIFLSTNVPINETFRFSGEVLYKYNLNAMESKTDFQNIVDADLIKLNGLWKMGTSNLSFDAGRFIISDLSSTVFSQTSDGVNVNYETAKWKVGAYVGYTGLLNSLNVSMTDLTISKNDFYNLTVAYVPASVNFAYTSLFGSNVIGAQAYYFLGITEGLTNKLYGEISLSGPVSTSGSYSTSVVAGLNDKDFMLFAKADYSAFISKKTIVGGGIDFATKNFVTITAKTASSNGTPLSGVLVPRINGMFVSDKFIATLNEKIVFSIPQNQPDKSFDFVGLDSAITVLYNIFSDLQVGCDVGAFVSKEKGQNLFSVTAKATLVF